MQLESFCHSYFTEKGPSCSFKNLFLSIAGFMGLMRIGQHGRAAPGQRSRSCWCNELRMGSEHPSEKSQCGNTKGHVSCRVRDLKWGPTDSLGMMSPEPWVTRIHCADTLPPNHY